MKFSFESAKKTLKNTVLGVTAATLSVGAVHAKEKPALNKQNTSEKVIAAVDPKDSRILEKIDILESQFHTKKSKEVHDGKKAYVFISESKLMNNTDYTNEIDKLESIFTEDLENNLINADDRDYHVLDRSLQNLQGLNDEYQIDKRNTDKNFVLKKYIPPTDYIILKLEHGDLSYEYKGTFTIIDAKSKKIKKHTFTIGSDEVFNKAQEIRTHYKAEGYSDEDIKLIQDSKINTNNYGEVSKKIIEELRKIM